MELKTQTAPKAATAAPWLKNFVTIQSQALGPIIRLLTASNQPKHRKTLKNGSKTQAGRKSYLKEFEETPKSGVHALSSPRRTASFRAPSTADGRIRRIFREKFLSLKKFSQKKWWLLGFLLNITFLVIQNGRDEALFTNLSFSHLNFPKMTLISLVYMNRCSTLPRSFIFIISLLIPLMVHEYMLFVPFVASKIDLQHPNRDVSKNVSTQVSQKIAKFYVLTRFCETIVTVQSVSSSEI